MRKQVLWPRSHGCLVAKRNSSRTSSGLWFDSYREPNPRVFSPYPRVVFAEYVSLSRSTDWATACVAFARVVTQRIRHCSGGALRDAQSNGRKPLMLIKRKISLGSRDRTSLASTIEKDKKVKRELYIIISLGSGRAKIVFDVNRSLFYYLKEMCIGKAHFK